MLNASAVTALSLSRQAARRIRSSNFHTATTSPSFVGKPQTLVGSIGKRGKSTASPVAQGTKAEPTFIKQRRYQDTDEFAKKTWLSDPSTYPIFVVLGAALMVCGGRCIQSFFFVDDVKVDRDRKNRIVRSHEEKVDGTGQSFMSKTFAPENGDDPVYK